MRRERLFLRRFGTGRIRLQDARMPINTSIEGAVSVGAWRFESRKFASTERGNPTGRRGLPRSS